jgi:HlyD family secretion protein
VLIRIPNPNHLLKPGMNTEVEIHVGQANNVLAIPNAALRTQRDVASAAQVLGLDPNEVQQQLAAARQQPASPSRDSASLGGGTARRDTTAAKSDSTKAAAGGNTMTTPDGRTIQLPPGVTEAQIRSAFQKRMSGQELTPAEQNALAAMRQMMMRAGGGGGQGGGGFRRNQGEPSSYIVFALRNGKPTPVQIRTGLTDLDYVEVVSGLTEQDTVLVLPSASLVNAQRDMQQRMRNITGGGLPGVQQQTQTQTRPQATRP